MNGPHRGGLRQAGVSASAGRAGETVAAEQE